MNPYVFIVGATRSGTTLLQRMVDAHPQIAVIHKTHWIENAEQKKQAPPASTRTPRISHGRPKASRGRLRPLQLPDRLLRAGGVPGTARCSPGLAQRHRAPHRGAGGEGAQGEPGRITCKMNALTDHRIHESPYEASQTGVRIDPINTVNAWVLKPDDSFARLHPRGDEAPLDSQALLLEEVF